MKSASAATIALLALNQYLMAELYTITLLNGTVLRYTDADGDLLSSLGGNVNQSGTAQGGSTSSLTLSAAASSTPDAYANKAVRITGGTGAGQERNVQTSRKNWLPISASIGGTGWGNIDCTITLNAAAAPDGTMSSSLIGDADATSAPSLVANGGYTSFPAGTQVSDSIFIKAGTSLSGTLNCFATGDTESNANISWSGGVPSISSVANCTATVAPDSRGGGWYRLTLVRTTVGGGASSFRYWPCARNTTGLTGNTYVWGGQSEIGPVATDYIFTDTTAAVGIAVDSPWTTLPDATSTYDLVSLQQYLSTSPKVVRDRTKLSVGIEVDDMTVTLYGGINDLIQGIPFPQFVANGGFDGARLSVDRCFMATYGNTSAGVVNIFTGSISDVKPSRTEIALTVSSDVQLLDAPMPRNVYAPTCSHNLFDAGCGAVKASFGASSSCTSGSTRLLINCALAQASGYFDVGTITFNSGANAGATRTIKSYAPGVINLSLPLPVTPTVGDTFTAYAGCDKSKATCTSKFNRLASFRGFPFIPVPEAST
jgi:uncharacterized phage protein (TIGR02218 family)